MITLHFQVSIQDNISLSGRIPDLPEGQVHLWWADLTQHFHLINQFIKILNSDELQRMAAFYQDRDQKHFCIRHGILKILLGGYLAVPPQEILFGKTKFGKPFIANDILIRFNLSHSADHALIAVRRNAEIGVDIEKIRPLGDWQPLAERTLSPLELNQLGKIPESMQMEVFFQMWVRKEAYLKARGYGLQIEPLSVMILAEAEESAEGSLVYQDQHLTRGWRVLDLKAPLNYVAALCFKR